MTTNIIDKDGKSIDASTATVPSDRHFRNAWTLDGKVITEDLTESKKIFQDKIREVRKELLEAQDVAFMKALEAGDSDAQTTAKNAKTALRDAPASSAITNAKTIAELKSAWDTSILGENPYSQESKLSSQLNVDTIADKTGSGAVGLTKQEATKARLMFDHVNTNIDGSFNISSVADTATGQATPSFTNNISLGFSTNATSANTDSGQNDTSVRGGGGSIQIQVTTSYRVLTFRGTADTDDELQASITVGDLV